MFLSRVNLSNLFIVPAMKYNINEGLGMKKFPETGLEKFEPVRKIYRTQPFQFRFGGHVHALTLTPMSRIFSTFLWNYHPGPGRVSQID